MSYIDHPEKKQKHPHYEHRTEKLDRKDNQFSSKKFHHIRNYSTHKKILKSFERIGMCLNDKTPDNIPKDGLDKVCLILINDYQNDVINELGVGPLNDGYLIGLKHHRLGFKIFYIHNPICLLYTSFLGFFLMNTQKALTVYYTGRNNTENLGIQFKDHNLSNDIISGIITMNCNGRTRVIFINDCIGGGSVFNIHPISRKNQQPNKNMISFYVDKKTNPDSKESKRSHGIFTYYLCKITGECPNITPNCLRNRMDPSVKRFGESFHFDITDKNLDDSPIFFD